jgi:hypothetical protein
VSFLRSGLPARRSAGLSPTPRAVTLVRVRSVRRGRKRAKKRGGRGVESLPDSEYTHGFICDKLVGEKLDWWMVMTLRDQGVFRMCIHELGESRVNEAYALISVIRNGCERAFFVYLFGERSRLLRGSHSPLNDLCQ